LNVTASCIHVITHVGLYAGQSGTVADPGIGDGRLSLPSAPFCPFAALPSLFSLP